MPHANLWKRFCAQAVDGLLTLLFSLTILFLAEAFLNSLNRGLFADKLRLLAFVWPVVHLLYAVFSVSRFGQSLGKKALDLRIVDEAGVRPRPGRVFLRYLPIVVFLPMFCLSGFDSIHRLGFLLLVAAVFMLIGLLSPNHRMLHDRLAGTLVIAGNQEMYRQKVISEGGLASFIFSLLSALLIPWGPFIALFVSLRTAYFLRPQNEAPAGKGFNLALTGVFISVVLIGFSCVILVGAASR